MNKVRQAIQFHQFPPFNTRLEWIDVMDKELTKKTKEYIENGNLDFRILAVLIRTTLEEANGSEDIIDGILWNKLHDQNLVIRLIGEYCN